MNEMNLILSTTRFDEIDLLDSLVGLCERLKMACLFEWTRALIHSVARSVGHVRTGFLGAVDDDDVGIWVYTAQAPHRAALSFHSSDFLLINQTKPNQTATIIHT